MSSLTLCGPVSTIDAATEVETTAPRGDAFELTPSRTAEVGGLAVRRALPRRNRRTVGAWCFLDHFGPVQLSAERRMDIGPHPHIGLQTVTWLLEGEVEHSDSLGSRQLIRPSQLNLMTAGHGVAHAEQAQPTSTSAHGAQLWIAQPEETRHGPPAFEHHSTLPEVELGSLRATVLVGQLAGARSPARCDSAIVGADLAAHAGRNEVPLQAAFEHALVLLSGRVRVDRHVIDPGALAYLGTGRQSLVIDADTPTRALLLGGPPFAEPILMWWNFVARTHDEVDAAYRDWQIESARFGQVSSPLPRIPAPPPVWVRSG